MNISVTCQCGKQLTAPEELAGKRVKCSSCSYPVSIPYTEQSPSLTSSQAPAQATITIGCTCGKKFRVRESLAGKRVKCPACQQPLVVPQPGPSEANSDVPAPNNDPFWNDVLTQPTQPRQQAEPSSSAWTTSTADDKNPYQSPVATGSTGFSPTQSSAYRSAATLVLWLGVFLAIDAVFSGVLGIMSLVQATVLSEHVGQEELVEDPAALGFYLGFFCFAVLSLPIYLATVVLFCVWLHRANTNVRALGAREMEHSPGWSVGSFFVPFVNLVVPYRATNEIYRASDPQAGASNWKSTRVPTFLNVWWGCWIVCNILSNLEMRLGWKDDPQSQLAGAWIGVVSGALGVAAAVLAVKVVRAIHRRQETKSDRTS